MINPETKNKTYKNKARNEPGKAIKKAGNYKFSSFHLCTT